MIRLFLYIGLLLSSVAGFGDTVFAAGDTPLKSELICLDQNDGEKYFDLYDLDIASHQSQSLRLPSTVLKPSYRPYQAPSIDLHYACPIRAPPFNSV